MTPFANWTFFGLLLLYAVLPVLVLGLLGKASAKRCFVLTLFILGVIFSSNESAVLRIGGLGWPEMLGPKFLRPWHQQDGVLQVGPLYVFLLSALYLWGLCFAWLRWKSKRLLPLAILLGLAPILCSRLLPHFSLIHTFGFIGISYVTFRALDVIFSIHDGAVKMLRPGELFAFLFFFPTVSSGPIDRLRRFSQDWSRERTRAEFLDDLDFALHRVFRGFLYKFILAALIDQHLRQPLLKTSGIWGSVGMMYVYTAYLFFDFAGYSAFAVGLSRFLGVKSPENFATPFLARNIRDFWARWHMSLSFWLRDHVHMRFQLAAMKGKWFRGKQTASYVAVFLTFGIMGVWHGLAPHYLLYGLYHAILVSGYDVFFRWNKTAKFWPDGPWWRALNTGITFHIVAFGMLLFSGRLIPAPAPAHDEQVERADCNSVEGFVWQRDKREGGILVDLYVDYGWIARTQTDLVRYDLLEKGYGNGHHGYYFELPKWVRNGAPHIVEIRVVGTNRAVGKPKVVACPEPEGTPVIPFPGDKQTTRGEL